MPPLRFRKQARLRNELLGALRLVRWSVPAFMAVVGLIYTLIEHRRHINEPAWPWPTFLAVAVLVVLGPALSWIVLHWATRTALAYLASQEQLANRADELATLNKLSVEASRSLDLDRIITAILEQTADALGASAGMIFIQEDGQNGLRLKAHRGISLDMAQKESRLHPGHCLCGQAVATRQVLLVGEVGEDPRCTSDLCICEGFRSVACAPLIAKDQLVGLLQLASPEVDHFIRGQTDFLAATAAQVSVFIENARLYDKVRSFNVELEQMVNRRTSELEAARWALTEKARQLQRLLSESYRVQEDTQTRIAQDMHDGVTQMIVGALYETTAARHSLLDDPELADQNLARAQGLLSEVETEIRRVIYDLHPPILDSLGLVIALKRFASTFESTFGIRCHVRVLRNPRRLSKEIEIAIYRILQAALHNVATHAQATQVRVLFDFGANSFRVQVQDDGIGFDPEMVMGAPGDHLGLIGMKERADGIGAYLQVNASKDAGTQIEIHLPFPVYLEQEQYLEVIQVD